MATVPESSQRSGSDEITLLDLWRVIWQGKYLIVAITGVFTLLAVSYALMATEWYRANTLLVPADNQSMAEIGGQLGGLASLVGVGLGGVGTGSAEALAVLKSRKFAKEFISEYELLELFLDGKSKEDESLDIRDAVEFFHENVLRVAEDRETGHVTIAAEWTDPDTAAEWANTLVIRLNSEMRERAAADAQANIEFLRKEISSNNVVVLEQSISRIMEAEMQKLMLARGSDEYAFRVVDRAEPPRKRSRPKRTMLVISVFVVSGMLSVLIVFIRSAFRGKDNAIRQ
jgi:uncharacterized protein involved in exopolysaccharide biosynthesis